MKLDDYFVNKQVFIFQRSPQNDRLAHSRSGSLGTQWFQCKDNQE